MCCTTCSSSIFSECLVSIGLCQYLTMIMLNLLVALHLSVVVSGSVGSDTDSEAAVTVPDRAMFGPGGSSSGKECLMKNYLSLTN